MPDFSTLQIVLIAWAATNIAIAILVTLRAQRMQRRLRHAADLLWDGGNAISELTATVTAQTNAITESRIRDRHNRDALNRERELTDRTMLTIDSCLKNHTNPPRGEAFVFNATDLRDTFAQDPRKAGSLGEPFPINPFDAHSPLNEKP
jgi:hypothetical protein